jgi:hypothetical protein
MMAVRGCRVPGRCRFPALLAMLILLAAAVPARGDPSRATTPPAAADGVIAQLNEAVGWYRDATHAMRSIDSVTSDLYRRQDTQTALRILQRAFDAARARAAVLATTADDDRPAPPDAPAQDQAARRASLDAAIRQDEEEVGRLRDRLRAAPARERTALERQLAARSNKLELERARRDFLGQLHQADGSPPDTPAGLTGEIEALEDSIPELKSPGAPAAPPPAAARPAVSGAGAVLRRLIALQQDRRSLKDLAAATSRFGHSIDEELRGTRTTLRPMAARLRTLAEDPQAGGVSLADGQREFHELLDRARRLRAVVLPLREESALVRRYTSDLHEWSAAVDREAGQLLQSLAVQLAGVVISFVAILVGAVLWRVAAVRYIADPSRRRLVLLARTVVVTLAMLLVVIFRFTSELAALVTVLGFAAAGIAFALQTVLLAAVGYFSIIGPNGIRVGDRVGLQGPFGYVHGDVVEIGLLRIKLQELAGDLGDLRPTGRIVVFPNSAIFTGSFFRHPAPTGAP